MKDRIKQIRKLNKLNQENFGKRLGITKTAVSKMELGTYSVTDTMQKLICTEFNINEDWLRYGRGEMLNIHPEDIWAELEKKYKMGEVFKKAVAAYLEADEVTRKAIDNYLNNVFKSVTGKG